MFTNPNLLVSKVIKGKYFPQSSIFEAKSKYGSSWIWQSLQSSLKMLESGLRSQVGDGKTINIWKDKWLKGNKKDGVTLMRPPNCKWEKVSELMNGQKWNERKISAIFSMEDACKIKSIPLSLYRKNDRKIWTATKNGRYTTRTGYDRAKELMKEDKGQNQQEAGSSRNKQDPRIWHQVWDLNVKHKVKLFLWKCLHNVLPTSENIFRRVRKGDHWCKRCGADVETVEHLFFHCKENYMIWETFPIQWEGLHEQTGSFWEWWTQLQQARNRAGGKEHIEATVNLLWQVWKSRNNWYFNSNKVEGHKVSQRAMTEWLEYKDATKHQSEEMQINRSSRTGNFMLTTELHSQHAIVIYTDAAHNRIKGKFGIGIAAKDGNGKLMCTWAIPCVAMENAAILEALAIRTCLLKAVEENWTDLLIVSDCKELVTSLSQENEDLSDFDVIVNDIKTLSRSFWRCSFSFSKREGNSCCHGLAQLATNLICESKWKTSFPVWVSKSAQTDYLAVASSFV